MQDGIKNRDNGSYRTVNAKPLMAFIHQDHF